MVRAPPNILHHILSSPLFVKSFVSYLNDLWSSILLTLFFFVVECGLWFTFLFT